MTTLLVCLFYSGVVMPAVLCAGYFAGEYLEKRKEQNGIEENKPLPIPQLEINTNTVPIHDWIQNLHSKTAE